jgi:gluconate kinase
MIFFVTGASGSGKSACLPRLSELLPGVALHDFDELGVPADADKIWRQRTTEDWLRRGIANEAQERSTMICGGAVLGEILACPSASNTSRLELCFLDCSDIVRIDRLRSRDVHGATQDTLNWAAWQRVHVIDPQWRADVIAADSAPEMRWIRWSDWQRGDERWRAHIIDTTELGVSEVAEHVAAWARSRLTLG